MKESGYKFVDHTADVQVKSWGRSLEEAFAQTAYSLMATITPDLNRIAPQIEKVLKVGAEDKESLLFDFLSEFLYIFDVDELVFSEIDVKHIKKVNEQFELHAVLKGEKFDKHKHKVGIEVKAITYSFMKIEEELNRVEIDIVFDI